MTLRRLDRERPFGTIHGGARVLFDQDGIVFDEKGKEIRDVPPDDPEPEEEEAVIAPDAAVIDYSKLPLIQLKRLMDSFGEKFVSKRQALDFLEGRSA